jgi:predicted aldo/keto reductase-like oxidoreductase
MQYRTLGRTGLAVSAVGFGTTQLRRVTRTAAIDTLLTGFDLGVNIVHVAPDYEGAEDLIAAALARTRKKVIVACNGYDVNYNRTGPVKLFESLFEATCRRFKTDRLDLFGIASVDDREAFGENVWGRDGMVDFLQRQKARGRLGATFCTTHGKPEFTRKLIESGAFDAVMLAYNDLGFHLLTINPPENWHFENIARTRSELFPLCQKLGVGLMIMLPFGGGLICRSKAFPPDEDIPDVEPKVSGQDVLRSILANSEVGCVLPGTASVAEADENARAGHIPLELPPAARQTLANRLAVLQTTLCSRCGQCEPTCSQGLPISWLFRAGYMSLYPCSPYETWEEIEYFRKHPNLTATCDTCPNVTCVCPSGINIPKALAELHAKLLTRLRRGELQGPPESRPAPVSGQGLCARVVTREIPSQVRPGQKFIGRIFLENHGDREWTPRTAPYRSGVRLQVLVDGSRVKTVDLRQPLGPNSRCHFVFELTAPRRGDRLALRLQLLNGPLWPPPRRPLVLLEQDILLKGHE